MNLHNEEIRAIQNTLVALKRGIALEGNQSKRDRMKRDVRELEHLLKEKLSQCSDFDDIKIEEDIY